MRYSLIPPAVLAHYSVQMVSLTIPLTTSVLHAIQAAQLATGVLYIIAFLARVHCFSRLLLANVKIPARLHNSFKQLQPESVVTVMHLVRPVQVHLLFHAYLAIQDIS